MTATQWRRSLAACAALLLAGAAPATAGEAARGEPLKLQGTWTATDGKGSGTWALRTSVEKPDILRGRATYTDWEAFSGTLQAAGIAGLEKEIPVTGWMAGGKIAIRIDQAPWNGKIVVGTLDGGRVSGELSGPDGRTGSVEGWWIVPKDAPVNDSEPPVGTAGE
jgi:hypothetical protein